jgi:site-specific recombinase XerD
MSDLLVPIGQTEIVEPEVHLSQEAAEFAVYSKGEGTRVAYRKAWRAYVTWCQAQSLVPLACSPGQIGSYLARRANSGLSASSIGIAAAAIKEAYRLARVPLAWDDPDISMVLDGIRRRLGTRPVRQSAAITTDVLAAMVATRQSPDTMLGARDRAMLVLGYHSAMRRSELVALDLSDVTIDPGKGVVLRVRRSKADQEGVGAEVALGAIPDNPECCPIVTLERWLKFRRPVGSEGPLFCAATRHGYLVSDRLSDKAVSRLVKDAAEAAGLPADEYTSHGFRRGLLTDAANNGAQLKRMMDHARQKTPRVTLGYIARAERWKDNVSAQAFRNSSPKVETDA